MHGGHDRPSLEQGDRFAGRTMETDGASAEAPTSLLIRSPIVDQLALPMSPSEAIRRWASRTLNLDERRGAVIGRCAKRWDL